MPRQVIVSAAALTDIVAARRWLTQPGAGSRAAERLQRIGAAIRGLKHHPLRWPIGDHSGVRERPIEGYRIMYEVLPDTGDEATAGDVFIVRVFGPFQDRTQL